MDWLTFISKLIDALAWPIVAVVIALAFKRRIIQVLPAVKRFKAGPLEAEFDLEAQKLLDDAAKVEKDATEGAEPEPEQDRYLAALLRTAAIRPSGAIMDAWRDVEEAMINMIADKGLYVPEGQAKNVGAWINAIAASKLVPLETLAVLHELRELRNKVAHATGFEPTVEAALNYVHAAQKVITALYAFVRPGAMRLRFPREVK